ncbi:MAG TPA: hypothetical protein DDX85_07135 [Nitrospiraceae bacterium]|nr:hypothetical protein [Nitrospiraceae bacterium]
MTSFAHYIDSIMRKIHPKKEGDKGLSIAARSAHDKPIHEAKYVVFDTELTGLHAKKDSIVSIGAVKMDGNRVSLGDFFYRIIEPKTALTGKSVVIHGITPTEASESPEIDILLPEFMDFCSDSIMVGHFVSIDLGFLNKEIKRIYGTSLQNPAVDTLLIYRWIRKIEEKTCAYHAGTAEQADLFTLADKYEIPFEGAHNALNDAFVTAQLFQRFLSVLPGFGVHTVGELLKIGGPRISG